MLHKERSKRTAILKYGLFLPLFAITLIMSSATIRDNKEIREIADNMPLDQQISTVKKAVEQVVIEPVTVHKLSSGNANWEPFYKFMMRFTRYPSVAFENKLQGSAVIKFSINNGNIDGVGTASKPLGSGLEAEVMRVILSYKDFTPKEDGDYIIPVKFVIENTPASQQLKAADLKLPGYTLLSEVVIRGYAGNPIEGKGTDLSEVNIKPNNSEKVYDFVSLEAQPTFPGGMEKFYEYISKTVRYPEEAQNKNIQGKVFLSFVVETDGTLTNIKVDRKLSPELDEEAVRIIEKSPKWVPGTQDGHEVRVKYNIPISFTLNQKKDLNGQQINGLTLKLTSLGIMSATSPLCIIDGKECKADFDLNSLDPNSISSIEVLKDATATSLYGPKGKNGVIIITTKTGQLLKQAEKEKPIEVKKEK